MINLLRYLLNLFVGFFVDEYKHAQQLYAGEKKRKKNMFGQKNKRSDFDIFTIYDSKTQIYDRPIFAHNKNELIRDVINMFKDPGQKASKLLINAEDYSIFKIGSYDKLSGQIDVHTMEHVANLHDLRAIAAPQEQEEAKLRALSAT